METMLMPELLTKSDGPAKEHRRVHGLDIAIETPRGATRSGTDRNGKKWSVRMEHDYGYIRRTEGADGDAVDVFLGPYEDSDRVFVVNQIEQDTGDFDEHKVMMGFRSMDEARYGYLVNYEQGWRVGSVKEMTVPEFKDWLKEGDMRVVAKAERADLKALVESLFFNIRDGGPGDVEEALRALAVEYERLSGDRDVYPKDWMTNVHHLTRGKVEKAVIPFTHVRHARTGRCGTVVQTLSGGRARLLLHDRGITKPMSLRGFVAVIDDDDVRKAPFCDAARRLTAT